VCTSAETLALFERCTRDVTHRGIYAARYHRGTGAAADVAMETFRSANDWSSGGTTSSDALGYIQTELTRPALISPLR